jgi:hypothetical protein
MPFGFFGLGQSVANAGFDFSLHQLIDANAQNIDH